MTEKEAVASFFCCYLNISNFLSIMNTHLFKSEFDCSIFFDSSFLLL